MIFDTQSIMIYIGILVLALFLMLLFMKPLRWLFKLIINTVLGGIVIVLINMVGGFGGAMLMLNPFCALIIGLFGFPGLVTVVIAQHFLY